MILMFPSFIVIVYKVKIIGQPYVQCCAIYNMPNSTWPMVVNVPYLHAENVVFFFFLI